MPAEHIEQLKRQFTGCCVTVDAQRPELARMAGKLGHIKTINFNARALVQFDEFGPSWYDIDLNYLKVVQPPKAASGEWPPPSAETHGPPSKMA